MTNRHTRQTARMLFYRGEKVIAPVGLIHTFSQIFFTTIRSNIVNALCFSVANIFFLVEFLYSFFLSDSHDKYPQIKSFFLARLTIQRAWFVENVKQKTIAIHIWRYKRHNWRKKKMIKTLSILNLTTSWMNPIASYAFCLHRPK